MEQTRLASANWSAATAATMALPDHDLWAAVRRLPRRQRQAIVLRYVGDLAEHDIATVMGVHRGTVASTLAKAHRRLASLTEQHETNAEVPHG
jgi:DNA-directed RNA polymerase specialized sigma24 family protein